MTVRFLYRPGSDAAAAKPIEFTLYALGSSSNNIIGDAQKKFLKKI